MLHLISNCFFKKQFIVSLVLITSSTALVNAQVIKRLYIANDDHTDYMWTADEAAYDSAFVHMLDYYLNQVDSMQNEPDDLQARFNCDGSIWLKAYQKYRSPQQFLRLINAIRSGHISSPLNSVVSTYGGQPTEAVIRGMYEAGKLERKFGLRFRLAVSMENQTMPLGLSSLWAGSGAKYSWKGVCACASRLPDNSFKQRRNQLYKYTGLDQTGVIMKWYNLGANNTFLGGYAEARGGLHPADPVLGISSMIRHLDSLCVPTAVNVNYPYHVAGAFGYGWDDLATYVAPAFHSSAKSMTIPQRRVRVSNQEDFFKEVEKHYPALPVETLSYGNEWDTYPASMNETTAMVKRATEKLRTAEALSSVVTRKQSDFGRSLITAKEKAWEAFGLYWEHDWTADGPVSKKARADWQIKLQQQISSYVDTLYAAALTTLGTQINKGTRPRFFVFNPLGWVRNDVVDIEYSGTKKIKVIDLSNRMEAPAQFIKKNNKSFLRISANNIPSVGYKVYEIQEGTPRKMPVAASLNGAYCSNNYYRLQLTRSGVITALYDKLAGNRQLVQLTDGKYLNDLGAGIVNEGEPLVIENAGPVSVTVKAVSHHPIQHTVAITLYAGSPRIEIENQIQQNFGDLKTWAFSFNLRNATARHEELGAILTVKKENSGGHYANQNARYDWLTFNHFVNISEQDHGVTLSNLDCSFFKLGNSTADSLWAHSSQINALAGGQTDGEKLGIIAQNGASVFNYHFALRTHTGAFNAAQAIQFSMEHQNPLVAGRVTGGAALPQVYSYSLLQVSHRGVLLWAVKPSEDNNSTLMARLWNINPVPVTTKLTFAGKLTKAAKVSHIETEEEEMKNVDENFTIHLKGNQMGSYKMLTIESK